MNPSSGIENGHKTGFVSELEDMVFLLMHFAKLSQFPVEFFFLEELKKVRWFSFRGKSNKEAAPASTVGFVVAQSIKQLLKPKRSREPRLACA